MTSPQMTSEYPAPLPHWAAWVGSFLCGAAIGYCTFSIRRRLRERGPSFYEGEAGSGGSFRDLARSETDTLFVLDASLTVCHALPAVREVLGYSPGWLAGREISGYLHPDDIENFTNFTSEGRGKPVVDFRMRHAEGSWRSLQASKTSLAKESDAGAYQVHLPERVQETPRRGPSAPAAGLVSREIFMERLERALGHPARQARHRKSTTVIVFSIDNFDAVGESLGRAAGDQALAIIGLRLGHQLRPEDTLAQTGRGEFSALLEHDLKVWAALRVAERITDALNAPILMDGRMLYVTVSAGIASGEASLQGQGGGEDFMRAAISAVQNARENGTRYEIFNGHTPESDLERLKLESDLRRAIERGELTLHYQPQVILETGEVIGMEALLRWEYPRRGTVPPKEFMAFIEATGLIVPFGIWVLREACRSAVLWRDGGGRRTSVSVNLSARQFQQPDLAGKISGVLRETGIEPEDLVLEITETLLLDDTWQVSETLRKIKSLGVKLALDDFGTGYSSLSYLERMPVDYLKIDKSFVSRLCGDKQDAAVLLSAILGAAETLGIRTIAEGLETEAQLGILKELRCEMGQGYYYSEPLPLEEASRLIGTSLPSKYSVETAEDVSDE